MPLMTFNPLSFLTIDQAQCLGNLAFLGIMACLVWMVVIYNRSHQ